MKYIKRPVEVDAIQFTGDNKWDVLEFIRKDPILIKEYPDDSIVVARCDGEGAKMRIYVGSYIVIPDEDSLQVYKKETFESKFIPKEVA